MLRQVAQGMTDAQVAEKPVISHRTLLRSVVLLPDGISSCLLQPSVQVLPVEGPSYCATLVVCR